MHDTLHIKVILGSAREARQADKVANWVMDVASSRPELSLELIDLAEENLPVVLSAMPPAGRKPGEYPSEQIAAWGKKIADADGYIFLVTEYNHGYTAVLKNAIDHLHQEWAKKPVAYVGYSMAPEGGVRAIEQLIPVTVQLGMAQALPATRIGAVGGFDGAANMSGATYNALQSTTDSLTWWAKTLKSARHERAKLAV